MPYTINEREWYETSEIMEMFDWSRQNVSMISMREGWEVLPGFRNAYLCQDVDDYKMSREHTAAAKNGGLWRSVGLLRHRNGYSGSCPVCNHPIGQKVFETWQRKQLAEQKEG